MLGLIGYALLSIITALVLSPVIRFGRGFSPYLCVFGMVYLVLLLFAPTSYFEPNWFKFIGYGISLTCLFIFIYIVWKKMKKEQVLADIVEEETK